MVFYPPVQIIRKAAKAGEYKLGLPVWNMLLRGFMAGAYVAMGAALATVCSTGTENMLGTGITHLVNGAVFPVGIILILLTGAELFTGDAMLAPLAAFIHIISWKQVLSLWALVYVGNFLGAVFYAFLMANGPLTNWSPEGSAIVTTAGITTVNIAAQKCSYISTSALWSCFLKAVGSNWLLNLAVLLGICADDLIGKMAGIWFPVMAFVSTGFEHCVANMYYIPAGLMTAVYLTPRQVAEIGPEIGNLAWSSMWTNNLICVTAGNIIGGVLFVGLLYWYSFKDEL